MQRCDSATKIIQILIFLELFGEDAYAGPSKTVSGSTMADFIPAFAPATTTTKAPANAILLAAFSISLFASAFLLFSVQPVVSRLVLPRLGGSPSVWNTCVCFFQAALLLGYLYAHVAATRLSPRAQVALHTLILLGGVAAMPLSLGAAVPPADAYPAPWLLLLLARTVGPPFVAIAATAPLLQSWFARTTHPHASDPYFLYAASNIGSLVALLGYPVLIETTLDLSDQVWIWSLGFGATAAAVLICGVAALQRSARSTVIRQSEAAPTAIGIAERWRWLALAFVPSALMLAVTTHITTDVASAPLFWMIPLAIYILTFVVAFASRKSLGWRALVPLQAVALAATGATGYVAAGSLHTAALWVLLVGLPLAAFTLTASVCHFELARRRPDVRHLTSYFLLISVGGALGGVFNVLLAPQLFPVPLEYPILLVAACLLRPPPARRRTQSNENWAARGDLLLPLALTLLLLGLAVAYVMGPQALAPAARVGVIVLPAAALLWFSTRRLRLAFGLVGCLLVPALVDASDAVAIARSFFGVIRVERQPAQDLVVMRHGTTIHGVESTRPNEALMPLGYYNSAGPFGRFFAALERQHRPTTAVEVVGLGTGALGCYARPGETWTFREIDQLVERMARDERWFHFMTGCGNHPTIILGDARVTLTANTATKYDLLIIDAFSSDSVPIHLITREALKLYFAHLKPGGIVLFHVSNRYLDLAPVVARLAADAGAPVRHLFVPSGNQGYRQIAAEVLAMAAPGGELDALAADGWDVPAAGPVLWTDERSDILGVIRWD